jgi:hypothetical protein
MTSILFCFPAYAEVNDSQNILPQVDLFLEQNSFSSAFLNGDSVQIHFSDCLSIFTCGGDILSTAKVQVITNTDVKINMYDSKNSLTSIDKISEAQWNSLNRNYLRAWINKIGSFGFEVTVNKMEPVACPKLNFISKDSTCLTVSVSGKNRINQTTEYQFTLNNSPIALAQIISYTQADRLGVERVIKYHLSSAGRINP